MPMNWDDLRIISAICGTGSFTRAARELQIDETTVSRRLSRLEAAMDVILFEAVDGHRRPTAACRTILRHLDDMEQSADNIHRLLQGQNHALRKFRLTTVAVIAEYVIAPQLARLLSDWPELSLNIDSSDQNADMSRWEADFAIRLGRPKQGAFLMRKIGQMRFCLVRPKDGGAMARAVVAGYPAALSETPEMVQLAHAAGDRPVRLETTNFEIIRRLIETGEAIAVLPDFLAEACAPHDLTEILPIAEEREVWLLSQPHLRNDPLARQVADWCSNLLLPRSATA